MKRPRSIGWRMAASLALLCAAVLGGAAFWRRTVVDPALLATARRGTLTVQLTTSGILRPVASLAYRSPVVGRELEILELAPEGSRIKEGDLLVRLDATELQRDIDRLRQELRQMQLQLQVAHAERQEAEAAIKMVTEGEGALTIEEARMRFDVATRKVERLRQESQQLEPLLRRGFITREELARTSAELEQAEEELALARKRHDVTVRLTHPRETQRANLQLAQKQSQLEDIVGRVQETDVRLQQLVAMADACTIRARRPGLVVYEQFMNANPRRKIRAGDRVSATQGLVTIPEVSRMVVEGSVSEVAVHQVRPGQTATVRLEAFPALRLAGKVVRVGTLATTSAERPLDDKRFDLVIELDPTNAELRPEMTARADVIVDVRPNALLLPINAIFEEGGGFVVHLPRAGGVESRAVQLGASNDRYVEILGGLTEQERVLLAPAAAAPATTPAAAAAPDSAPGPVHAASPR